MYRYDSLDRSLVAERVAQFRDQTRRFLTGELTEDEFRPLRLQNGLYVQRHAPMLRVAIPYGMLSAPQLRTLAHIARTYDRGYGHFTTRQNLQFNWPRLEAIPDILAELAKVEMHAIQTSGNCIRNTTSDQFAGVAHDEIVDPRPYCELIRQWSTFHPEFAYLPRKFKIAVSSSVEDRAATFVHDIGLHILKNDAGDIGARVIVGGGLGRTPVIGSVIREFIPRAELINYLDAILRVYNRFGRRDNKYKARIKILVRELTVARFTAEVEAEFAQLAGGLAVVPDQEFARLADFFGATAYESLADTDAAYERARHADRAFARWVEQNTFGHKVPGYAAVTLSLKAPGVPPGDASAEQMDTAAELAERYSFGELRVSHEQNLILADVRKTDLFALWQEARKAGLATPNIGLIGNIICCPGGDFCSLANAKSIPIAAAIVERCEDLDYQHDLGPLDLNISGCINSCGHHHVGHIGILGVDKDGAEFYQVTLGGSQGLGTSLGKVIGRSFAAHEIASAVVAILEVYVEQRLRHHGEAETFLETVRRIGLEPFRARVYGTPALEAA
ncbi:MAG: nitrite/sulfite reductase [Burkholderiales bacterium]|nr:nitrite/sulfite reductase [Burkholderiales bacterium]